MVVSLANMSREGLSIERMLEQLEYRLGSLEHVYCAGYWCAYNSRAFRLSSHLPDLHQKIWKQGYADGEGDMQNVC